MLFKRSVAIAGKKPLKQGNTKKLPLAQRNVLYIEGIFRVIIAVFCTVKGDWGIVKKLHLLNVSANCAHSDFQLFGKVVCVGVSSAPDFYVDCADSAENYFFLSGGGSLGFCRKLFHGDSIAWNFGER